MLDDPSKARSNLLSFGVQSILWTVSVIYTGVQDGWPSCLVGWEM